MKKAGSEKVLLSSLKKNPSNPRLIKDAKFELLKKSISEFPKMMELRPIIIDSKSVVLGGNMRLEALKALGYKDVPASWVKKASALTEAQKKQFVIKDNNSFGEYDWDLIANEWSDLPLSDWGVDIPDDWLTEPTELIDVEPQIDKAELLNKKWKVKTGDLFVIGSHRLLCGDSTKREDVERLMSGEKADCVCTDPPFFTPATHYQSRKGWQRNYSDMSPLREFWRTSLEATLPIVKQQAHWYVFCNCDSYPVFYEVTFNHFDKIKTLIWNKGHVGLGRIWRNQHELILWARNKEHYFISDGKLRADVLTIDATTSTNRDHPVEKPSLLLSELIEASTLDGATVYEPFAGSGTTLVACENLKRKCFAIEISPNYCSVVLQRMSDAFPSLLIKKLEKAKAA